MVNWFTSLPLWFTMPIVGGLAGVVIYRLARYGLRLKVKAPGGAEGEIDAGVEPPDVIQKSGEIK